MSIVHTVKEHEGFRYVYRNNHNLNCPTFYKTKNCGNWCPKCIIDDENSLVVLACTPGGLGLKFEQSLIKVH